MLLWQVLINVDFKIIETNREKTCLLNVKDAQCNSVWNINSKHTLFVFKGEKPIHEHFSVNFAFCS